MKRSVLRRAFTGLTICALLLSLLGGCDSTGGRDILLYGPDEGGREKISLTFFGYKADAMNQIAIEAAMQGFMAEHRDVDITYEGIKGLVYWDAFDKRDAANDLDDVFMMHHDHLITLSAQGKLADLSGLSGLERYTEMAREQFTNADGTVYFLPTAISTYNLYINYDLLKADGQSVPEDWAQFRQVCDWYVGQGVVPIIANDYNSLPTLIVSRGLFDLYQRPEAEVDAALQRFNEDPSLLAEALAPGVEQMAEMLGRGWFDPEEILATGQTAEDLELFLRGDRPFLISGGWAVTRVNAMEPAFSYGIHPYPILDDGCVLSFRVDTCISVNAASEHLEEAKAFMEHLISPDVMWFYCDSQASYCPLEGDRVPSEPELVPSYAYLGNGRSVLGADYRLDLPVETALQSCMRTLLSGGSAAEAREALALALLER